MHKYRMTAKKPKGFKTSERVRLRSIFFSFLEVIEHILERKELRMMSWKELNAFSFSILVKDQLSATKKLPATD